MCNGACCLLKITTSKATGVQISLEALREAFCLGSQHHARLLQAESPITLCTWSALRLVVLSSFVGLSAVGMGVQSAVLRRLDMRLDTEEVGQVAALSDDTKV